MPELARWRRLHALPLFRLKLAKLLPVASHLCRRLGMPQLGGAQLGSDVLHLAEHGEGGGGGGGGGAGGGAVGGERGRCLLR